MEIYWLWLNQIKGVGPATLRKLVNQLGSPRAVYDASHEELLSVQGLRAGIVETLLVERSLDVAKRVQEKMLRDKINLLVYEDLHFPSYINQFPSLPAVLYYQGHLCPVTTSIGIVGSRRCTSYGKEVAAEAAIFLAKSGVTVVSGMAKGIDSYAHTACLKAGGYTLAFVANGLDICYPPEHRVLMEEISHKGAVISPYPPGTRPRQEFFPHRNKLLAAWVDRLLVVEASERSGALLTAGYAKDYGRAVYAVPNSIYASESRGCNRLLFDGAEVYLEPKQLIGNKIKEQEMNAEYIEATQVMKRVRISTSANHHEKAVLERLDKEPQDTMSFLDIFNGDLGMLLESLCQMELEGKLMTSGQWVTRLR